MLPKLSGLVTDEPPPVQLAIFLGLAVVVRVIAAVVPARRGARLQVLEALHTE